MHCHNYNYVAHNASLRVDLVLSFPRFLKPYAFLSALADFGYAM